jgi:hypothetical protein
LKRGINLKKVRVVLVMLFVGLFLTACSSAKEVTPDYTTAKAEEALNNGDDLTGKTVEITVDKYVPDGSLGYTIQTGEHLNFVSSENPKVKEGDKLIVKIVKTTSVMGSFVMTFEKV